MTGWCSGDRGRSEAGPGTVSACPNHIGSHCHYRTLRVARDGSGAAIRGLHCNNERHSLRAGALCG